MVTLTTILYDSMSGPAQQGFHVITDENALASFQATLREPAMRLVDGDFVPDGPRIRDIDFAQYMLLAAAMGEKRTGGYSITMLDAEVKPDGIYLRVHEHTDGQNVTQLLTYPVHVVRIEKTEAPVHVVQVSEEELTKDLPKPDIYLRSKRGVDWAAAANALQKIYPQVPFTVESKSRFAVTLKIPFALYAGHVNSDLVAPKGYEDVFHVITRPPLCPAERYIKT